MSINVETGDSNKGDATIQGPQNVTPVTEANYWDVSRYLSTLSPSEVQAFVALLAAWLPVLPPPIVFQSQAAKNDAAISQRAVISDGALSINRKMQETQQEIIEFMWDQFIKRLDEEAKFAKEADIKRQTVDFEQKGGSQGYFYYQEHLLNRIGTDKDLIVNTVQRWMIAPLEISHQEARVNHDFLSYPSPQFMTAAFLTSVDIFQGDGVGGQLSTSPVADALYAMGPSSGMPMDTQGAAAMIAALMYGGALNRANSETISQAEKEGKSPQNLSFAIYFSQEILAIVAHVVEHMGTGQNQRNPEDRLACLILTLLATNLLYRTAYHGMVGEDLTSLLNGDKQLLPNIKGYMDELVRYLQMFLPSDPAVQGSMMANMRQYIDDQHSTESMLSTLRIYQAYFADQEQTASMPSMINRA